MCTGDRHLDNFLLSQSDGSLIGIDFGHQFGTALQFLPVPELMPFRLTRQLRNFLLPLDVAGLLKHNMYAVLLCVVVVMVVMVMVRLSGENALAGLGGADAWNWLLLFCFVFWYH